jgi:hypothetical protein
VVRLTTVGHNTLAYCPPYDPLHDRWACWQRWLVELSRTWEDWKTRLEDDADGIVRVARWSKGTSITDIEQ